MCKELSVYRIQILSYVTLQDRKKNQKSTLYILNIRYVDFLFLLCFNQTRWFMISNIFLLCLQVIVVWSSPELIVSNFCKRYTRDQLSSKFMPFIILYIVCQKECIIKYIAWKFFIDFSNKVYMKFLTKQSVKRVTSFIGQTFLLRSLLIRSEKAFLQFVYYIHVHIHTYKWQLYN